MLGEKAQQAGAVLEVGYVTVEMEPIQGLELESDVALEIADVRWSIHAQSGARMAVGNTQHASGRLFKLRLKATSAFITSYYPRASSSRFEAELRCTHTRFQPWVT